jgi:hypothetical protein
MLHEPSVQTARLWQLTAADRNAAVGCGQDEPAR